MKAEQISWFPSQDKLTDAQKKSDTKLKRNWENAFQKWSNKHGIENMDQCEDFGCCGYGSMCDWCEANDYGRPCVRALNSMCRENGIQIDYTDRDFTKVWNMRGDTK